MIVALATHAGDSHLAGQLLDWLAELGGASQSSLLLAYDRSLDEHTRKQLRDRASESFGGVEVLRCDIGSFPPERQNLSRPAANRMFKAVSDYIAEVIQEPFLWLEPDAVPLKDDWLSRIEYEYETCHKAFMGTVVSLQRAGHVHPYLCGVSVYPAGARDVLEPFLMWQEPWDTASSRKVIPLAHDTRLIQHAYHVPGTTFVIEKPEGSKNNVQQLDFLRPDAVLYHRVKNDSLINLLKRKEPCQAQ